MKSSVFFISTFSATALWITTLAWMRMPDWWVWIIREKSPMTWFEFGLLLLCSVLSALCAKKAKMKSTNKWFGLLALGFLYLSLDELLVIHETIREKILVPHQISFIGDHGDSVLLFLMVLGLAVLPKVMKCFRENRLAWNLFMVGVFFSGLAIVCDSVDHKTCLFSKHVIKYFWEEILETSAMLFFLNAFYAQLVE